MSDLDRAIPHPRLRELDGVDVAATPEDAWRTARALDLASSPLVRALFVVRTLPSRLVGRHEEALPPAMRIDDIAALDRPGFHVLAETPGLEVVVGAIGKVWQLDIPFVDVRDLDAYAAFDESGFIKVAWALRVVPRGERDARVEVEVRVDATDDASWERFRTYFRFVGPGSHFIRRWALASLARELGTPDALEDERPLPGDELLPDAVGQLTHGITIRAAPDRIWPWLVQMGGRRAGFYSIDLFDNANVPSARELHPELAQLAVGDVIPATPRGDDGFEVLRLEPPRVMVLGGLFDLKEGRQVPFESERPSSYWHMTWAFVLEPLGDGTTRLHVRARVAMAGHRWRAMWIGPVHHLMQSAQLENLAARAEGRVPREGWRDVLEGIGGAAAMAFDLLTPFLRPLRDHWGLDESVAARAYPGDELIPKPRWSWTHGIEIDAPLAQVWPWVAQMGADRGGFYSHQWLENLVGCNVKNAEVIRPEWELREGDTLVLHPKSPGLPVARVERGRFVLAHGASDEHAQRTGKPWIAVTWLFFLEPLEGSRTRLISRFRSACSDDLPTRLAAGPYLTEPIGFVMDRRMLIGIRDRVERRAHEALAHD